MTLPDLIDELFRVAATSLADQLDDGPARSAVPLRLAGRARRSTVARRRMRRAGLPERSIDHGAARVGGQRADVPRRPDDRAARAVARRMRSPRDLLAIDPLRTLPAALGATFPTDPQMVQWAGRYATYSGSSPARAPATLGCIAARRARYGCWYPIGGLGGTARCAGPCRRIDRASRCTPGGGRRDLTGGAVGRASRRRARRRTDRRRGRRRRRRRRGSTSTPTCCPLRTRPDAGRRAAAVDERVRRPRRCSRRDRRHRGTTTCGSAATPRVSTPSSTIGRLAAEPTVYGCVSSTHRSVAGTAWVRELVPAGERPCRMRRSTRRRTRSARARALGEAVGASTSASGRASPRRSRRPTSNSVTGRPAGAIYGTSSNGRRAAFVRPAQPHTGPRPLPRRRVEPSRRRDARSC